MRKHLSISVSESTEARLKQYAAQNNTSVSQSISDWIWSADLSSNAEDGGHEPSRYTDNSDIKGLYSTPHALRNPVADDHDPGNFAEPGIEEAIRLVRKAIDKLTAVNDGVMSLAQKSCEGIDWIDTIKNELESADMLGLGAEASKRVCKAIEELQYAVGDLNFSTMRADYDTDILETVCDGLVSALWDLSAAKNAINDVHSIDEMLEPKCEWVKRVHEAIGKLTAARDKVWSLVNNSYESIRLSFGAMDTIEFSLNEFSAAEDMIKGNHCSDDTSDMGFEGATRVHEAIDELTAAKNGLWFQHNIQESYDAISVLNAVRDGLESALRELFATMLYLPTIT